MPEMKSTYPDAKQQESTFKAVLQYAAVPLALVTSLLYLFGRVHYDTYLSYWGLPESLFPLSKDQSVISGFVHSLLYSSTFLPKILLALIVLSVGAIIIIVSTYRPFVEYLSSRLSRLQRKVTPIVQDNVTMTTWHDKLMNAISLATGGIVLFMFALLVIVWPWKWIADQAKESARKEHQSILAGKEDGKPFSSPATLYVSKESKAFEVYSGHLILTSPTHAAIYSKSTGVSIFPLSNVSRIVIRENKLGLSNNRNNTSTQRGEARRGE